MELNTPVPYWLSLPIAELLEWVNDSISAQEKAKRR